MSPNGALLLCRAQAVSARSFSLTVMSEGGRGTDRNVRRNTGFAPVE